MSTSKRVYICTPLKPEKFNLDTIQKEILKEKVFAYIPPTEEKNNPSQGARVNRISIEMCDELWVFGPIGRDCSWEIGYAQGLGKKVVFFVSDNNLYVLNEDWMLFSKCIEIRNVN